MGTNRASFGPSPSRVPRHPCTRSASATPKYLAELAYLPPAWNLAANRSVSGVSSRTVGIRTKIGLGESNDPDRLTIRVGITLVRRALRGPAPRGWI